MDDSTLSKKYRGIKLAAAGVLTSGMIALTAVPAMAQPVVTGGLVNVTITNVLNNNQVTVTVPIQAAANICGVQANVLAAELQQTQTVNCTSNPSQGTTVTVSRPPA